MRFSSLFKAAEVTTTAATTWRWRRGCVSSPKTLSFRATAADPVSKISPDSFFEHGEEDEEEESAVVSGMRSERLFFEPGETNSILEEAKHRPEISGEMVVMKSFDPVLDFRASMEEMVAAHGGRRDWEFMEELLTCYLEVNERRNHPYIVEAFADMVIHLCRRNLAAADDNPRRRSFTSPLSYTSSSASPCLSLPEKEDSGGAVVERRKWR